MLPLWLLIFHAAPSLPVATALNTSTDPLVTAAGALITVAASVMLAWIGSQLYCVSPQSTNVGAERAREVALHRMSR
jgi:hypothetical protein